MVNDTNATDGSTTDELMAEISQYWDNLEGSNIYELVDSFNEPMTGLSQAAQEIEDWREVKNAEGTTLDMIGRDREAYRPSNDDDVYRFLIYIRYLLSRAQGTYPSLVKIDQNSLGTDQNIKIWNTDQPHHVDIQLPWDYVSSDYMHNFLLKNLQSLLALGNWLDAVYFKSTTDLPLYIGVVGSMSNTSIWKAKTTIWWSGWKATTNNQIYAGVKGRISNTSIWSTETS